MGGALISLETPAKLTSIKNWLTAQAFTASYIWLNLAQYRNGSTDQARWSWVWALPGLMVPLDYDNWGVGQLDNLFSGDSVYLSTVDYKFYVNPNIAMLNPGIVCQSKIVGLAADQINIAVLNRANVYAIPTTTR
jgi:hypothetical protein